MPKYKIEAVRKRRKQSNHIAAGQFLKGLWCALGPRLVMMIRETVTLTPTNMADKGSLQKEIDLAGTLPRVLC